MRATLAIVGVGLLLGGCALSPPVHPNGLPRVPRYTNTIQLDFILSSYRTVADKAASQPEKAQLVEEACLGWERAVFDLHSARLYPSILRQTPETLMLEQLWQELPSAVQRHPRPAVCDALAVPVSTTGLPREVSLGVVASTPPVPPIPPPDVAVAPANPMVAQQTSPPALPSQPGTGAIMPAPSALPVTGQPQQPSAEPSTPAGRERVALQRLRMALSLPLQPPANLPSAQIDPTIPLAPPAQVDLPVLRELADSDLPTVRLRARYHLLGLCTLAVEAADRTRTPAASGSNTGMVRPTDPVVCAAENPAEPLRLAQRRLMRSLLTAWRARYSEPMADFVASMASFIARDNPVLDGPRTSR